MEAQVAGPGKWLFMPLFRTDYTSSVSCTGKTLINIRMIRTGPLALWDEAEVPGLVLHGEEKSEGLLTEVYQSARRQSQDLQHVAWREYERQQHNLQQGSCKLDIRRNFSPMRTSGQQSRLCRDIALSLTSEVFKTHLGTALSNFIWPQSCLCSAQEVRLEASRSTFPNELHFDPINIMWLFLGKKKKSIVTCRGLKTFSCCMERFHNFIGPEGM